MVPDVGTQRRQQKRKTYTFRMHHAHTHHATSPDKLVGIKMRFVSAICLSLFVVYCVRAGCASAGVHHVHGSSVLIIVHAMLRETCANNQRSTFHFHVSSTLL